MRGVLNRRHPIEAQVLIHATNEFIQYLPRTTLRAATKKRLADFMHPVGEFTDPTPIY